MSKYHLNKITLALSFLIVVGVFFIVISILGYVNGMEALPYWKIVLYYSELGISSLMFIGMTLYVPFLIITDYDKISILYIFPPSRNKVINIEEISQVNYPVTKMSMGRPHRVIEIVCKDGRTITLDDSYINLRKYLYTLQEITRCTGGNPADVSREN